MLLFNLPWALKVEYANGTAMTSNQLGQELEKIRRKDCLAYSQSEETIFHSDFAPNDEKCRP